MLKEVKDKSLAQFQAMLETQFSLRNINNPEAIQLLKDNMTDSWINGWDCCAAAMHTLINKMFETSLKQS